MSVPTSTRSARFRQISGDAYAAMAWLAVETMRMAAVNK
jgi:hypothetical protein